MLDVCLLGTAGMMPLPHRYLTSLYVRYNGSCMLVDCGEGTQVAMKKAELSSKPIDIMCFTHYHADHISGLPGMLLTMGNAERTEPVLMIGPKGLKKVVESLRIIAPELPFEIRYHELEDAEEEIVLGELKICAFKVKHNVPCYGYTFNVARNGKFNLEAALKLPVPKNYWGQLQKGKNVTYEGVTYTPDMVMGAERKGIKLIYCTDSRPCEAMVKNGMNADLAILEGMYAEPEKIEKAKQYKHMTFYEAAKIAKDANVKEMWLTHFSPSLVRAESYMDDVKAIFEKSKLGKDGKFINIAFEDEED